MRKGFTLLEIAIVMIIVGLLIGGILIARSLIDSARVQTLIRNIGHYDSAVAEFQNKYHAMPGEAAIMGCTNTIHSTCGNGVIEDAGFVPGGETQYFSAEEANFWPQLQANGMSGSFTGTITGKFNSNKVNGNAPATPIPNTMIIPFTMSASWVLKDTTQYYFLCNFSRITGTSGGFSNWVGQACWENLQVPVVDALALDTKLDDGNGNNAGADTYTNKRVIDYLGICLDGTTGAYLLDDRDRKCGTLITMAKTSGFSTE